MNRVIFSCLLFFCLHSSAQTVQFIDNDWNKARAEAKRQNKYLFVDAYTDWCYWCKVMDKKTFPDKEVAQFMDENFVSLKLEMEHGYGINVAMKYRVSAFPSSLIFSPAGKLVYLQAGYSEPAMFIGMLKKAIDRKEQTAYEGISDNVDLAFPDFYKKLFAGNGKREFADSAVVNSFLGKQKDLFSEVNYSVMLRFISVLPEARVNFLLENRKKYESLYGKSDIENAVYAIEDKLLKNAIKNKSNSDLESLIRFADKHHSENADAIKDSYRLNYYKGVQDWKMMAQEVDSYIFKSGYKSDYLNDCSWTIYEKCDDSTIIIKAISWLKPVMAANPEYAVTDTYAALLYKSKQYADAKTYALKAIELGKASGEKTEETEKLLKKIEAAN